MKAACFYLVVAGVFTYYAQLPGLPLHGGLLLLAITAAVAAVVTLATERTAR